MRRLDDEGFTYGSYRRDTYEIRPIGKNDGSVKRTRSASGYDRVRLEADERARRTSGTESGERVRRPETTGSRPSQERMRRPETTGSRPSQERMRRSSETDMQRRTDPQTRTSRAQRTQPSERRSADLSRRPAESRTGDSEFMRRERPAGQAEKEEAERRMKEKAAKKAPQKRRSRSAAARARQNFANKSKRDVFAYSEEEVRYRRTPAAKRRKRGRGRKISDGYSKTPKLAILIACIVIAISVAVIVIGKVKLSNSMKNDGTQAAAGEEEKKLSPLEQALHDADYLAQMYDYDGALDVLHTFAEQKNKEIPEITEKITEYETIKASCVEFPVEQITHVFFHALLYEPNVSFSSISPQPEGFNDYMTTVDEFNKMMQSMYDRGFVLVSIYDVAKPGADGKFEPGHIMLPPGKQAFVLSEDDVNYYHTYENGGIADKLVIDENGKVKTQYTYQNGMVEVGNHDVIPILDAFIEEHPDFCYKGARGIIALTGYNGILGYRTDPTYSDADKENRDRDQQEWLDAHPDFNFEQECEEAKRVAQAIKDDGWLIASHSWGHMWQAKLGDNGFEEDTKKWMERVNTLIGGTDIWIYPNGEDVDTDQYQVRFQCLQNNGFKYFCPVNSVQYAVRVDDYGLNMGRRNLDGYRMYYDMIDDEVDRLSDLFDVTQVFDPRRPTPVPEI